MRLSARQNPRTHTHTHTTHTQQKAQRQGKERDKTRELPLPFSFLCHLCHRSAIFSPSRPLPLLATASSPHLIVTSTTTTVLFSSCTCIVCKRRTRPLPCREAACITLNSILWPREFFSPTSVWFQRNTTCRCHRLPASEMCQDGDRVAGLSLLPVQEKCCVSSSCFSCVCCLAVVVVIPAPSLLLVSSGGERSAS